MTLWACSELGHDICEARRSVMGACSGKISSRRERQVMPSPLLGAEFLSGLGGSSFSLCPPSRPPELPSCAPYQRAQK